MDPTLDPAVLAELRALSEPGSDFVRDIAAVFAAEVPDQIAELRRAADQRDVEGLGRTAHRLKGSASGVGARVMAAHCAAIEDAARDGDLDRALAAATGLDDAFAAALQALERECS